MHASKPKETVVSTRMTRADSGLVRAAADTQGVSVATLVHDAVVPAAKEILRRELLTSESQGG